MLEHEQETAIAKENTQYKKSNLLINAKTKRTLNEEKVLAIVMQRIQKLPEVDGNIVCEMKANELRNLFVDEKGSLYSHLNQIANRFMSNGMIGFSDAENNRFDYLHVVTRAKYEDGKFTLKLNGDLKDHLIGMSKNYTYLDLPTMMNFKSVYSFRIYEIIKSREYTLNYKKEVPCTSYEIEFGLSEFKFQIGVADATEQKVKDILAGSATPDWDKAIEVCENQAHRDWRNFKRSVLNVAEKEINKKTEFNLVIDTDSYRGGKGGKVYGLKLIVTPKANENKEEIKEVSKESVKRELSDDEKLEYIEKIIEMIDEKITMKEARAILDACEYDIDKVKKNYSIAKKQGKIRNLVGFLIKACVDEYTEPIEINEAPVRNNFNNNFNNFNQNSYSKEDFEEIERQLLDN